MVNMQAEYEFSSGALVNSGELYLYGRPCILSTQEPAAAFIDKLRPITMKDDHVLRTLATNYMTTCLENYRHEML